MITLKRARYLAGILGKPWRVYETTNGYVLKAGEDVRLFLRWNFIKDTVEVSCSLTGGAPLSWKICPYPEPLEFKKDAFIKTVHEAILEEKKRFDDEIKELTKISEYVYKRLLK